MLNSVWVPGWKLDQKKDASRTSDKVGVSSAGRENHCLFPDFDSYL
jgi:hypothetical protein